MNKYFILSQEEDHIRVYEHIYGGTYDIMLTPSGDLDYAIRWMDRIGINPIRYSSVKQIPQIHRSLIEEVINHRRRAKFRALNQRA